MTASSRPELRFTLEQRDGDFCLWLPCFTLGAAAERLAGDLEDGMHICITSGRLTYKKRPTKAGEQARLEILVWSIERLSESPQVERTDEGKGDSTSNEPSSAPEPTVRKARYKKWTSEAVASN